LQNQVGGEARTYVFTRGKRVIGYSSLAPASVAPEDAPSRVMKGQGRYPVPVILMARFALDMKEQGKGYGKTLFRDALRWGLAERRRSAGAPISFLRRAGEGAPSVATAVPLLSDLRSSSTVHPILRRFPPTRA